MEILNSQLKNVLFGAVSIEEENGWLHPVRFTKEQFDYIEKASDALYLRSLSSSNMVLDFVTDAAYFSFDYKCRRASSQTICYIDVYVDGDLALHQGADDVEELEGTLEIALKEGTKRVTVYFPCLAGTRLANAKLSDGAKFEPAKKDVSIMFFGDSITQGYTTVFPSLTYANILARKLNANCINQGIGADIFNVKNLDENIDFNADIVFVAYGSNDWNGGVDIQKNASEYFEKLTKIYKNSKIYTLLPIWRGAEGDSPCMTFEETRSIIADICKKYDNIKVLDTIDYVPHFPEFFKPDLLHPNDLGFMLYAENIIKNM